MGFRKAFGEFLSIIGLDTMYWEMKCIETLSESDARKALKDLIKENIISDGFDM